MRISVIIPTLREADTVARAISTTRQRLEPFEVIVVDASSDDGTREVAEHAGARVIDIPGSRAVAMNAGAPRLDAAAAGNGGFGWHRGSLLV